MRRGGAAGAGDKQADPGRIFNLTAGSGELQDGLGRRQIDGVKGGDSWRWIPRPEANHWRWQSPDFESLTHVLEGPTTAEWKRTSTRPECAPC